MKKLIIVVLILIGINPAYAVLNNVTYEEGKGIFVNGTLYDKGGQAGEAYNSSYASLKPSCQIIPILDKEMINSGENFNISFQIACEGKVESNLINIYFPSEFLSPNKNAYFYFYLKQMIIGDKLNAVWLDEKPEIRPISAEGGAISLFPVTFMEINGDDRITFGEKTIRGHPPLLFTAFSSEKAALGDNKIKIIFHYSDGKEWYSSQEEVTIHIREWYEKTEYQISLALLPIVASIIGFAYRKRKKLKEKIRSLF